MAEPAAVSRSDGDAPAYATALVAALEAAGVATVAALPDSLLEHAYRLLRQESGIRYVQAGNEADLPGIAAGAYMGGQRAVILMENSGLRQACEPIARFAFVHHMPLVMLVTHRGDLGERNWWGHNHSQTMVPLLDALRIPYWCVRELDRLERAVSAALDHADSSQWPVALVIGGECVEGGQDAAH